jgi:hypothetical protein
MTVNRNDGDMREIITKIYFVTHTGFIMPTNPLLTGIIPYVLSLFESSNYKTPLSILFTCFNTLYMLAFDRLCGLVARVPGYRSRGLV